MRAIRVLLGNYKVRSRIDYYRAILVGAMGLFGFVLGLTYSIYNAINQVHQSHFVYILLQVIGVLTVVSIRFARYDLAKVILLIGGNLIVYLLAAKGYFETDTQYIFLFLSLCSYALFGFEKKALAWFFTILPVLLFIFGLYSEYSPLEKIHYPKEYLRFNQGVNFLITSICSIGMLYALSRITFESEAALRKKHQKILLKNERLKKANQELDKFVYSTSHELRSPLRSLLGLITISRRANSAEEQQEYFALMENRIEKLDELLKKIATYSRNASGKTELQEVNLSALVEMLFEDFRFINQDKKIKFINEVNPQVIIKTDEVRLRVILQNLIGNAFNYHDLTKVEPFIKVEASVIKEECQLTVIDNGRGIQKELQPLVFDMFYRGTQQSGGSGLGLYIVKETVEKLKGKITLQSEYGSGSAFSITIPVEPK